MLYFLKDRAIFRNLIDASNESMASIYCVKLHIILHKSIAGRVSMKNWHTSPHVVHSSPADVSTKV